MVARRGVGAIWGVVRWDGLGMRHGGRGAGCGVQERVKDLEFFGGGRDVRA